MRALVRVPDTERERIRPLSEICGGAHAAGSSLLRRLQKAEIWLRDRIAVPQFFHFLHNSLVSELFSVRDVRRASSFRHVERARRFRERVAAVVSALTGLKKVQTGLINWIFDDALGPSEQFWDSVDPPAPEGD